MDRRLPLLAFALLISLPDAQAYAASSERETLRTLTISETVAVAMQGRSARLARILALEKQGVIGETHDGLVALVRTAEAAPTIERLIRDENNDRMLLYEDYLRQHDQDQSRKPLVQRLYAEIISALSPPGTWFQDPAGVWSTKAR